MRIAFVWPHGGHAFQTLPLSLGILNATIADQGHSTRLFDLPLEGWTADSAEFRAALGGFRPDLVAVSSWAVSFRSAVEAARVARDVVPDATVLLGGNYASLCPREAYAPGCFDYLLRGEAERTFPEFVRCLAAGDRDPIARLPGIYFRNVAGELVSPPRPPPPDDLDAFGGIDYEFLQLERALQKGYFATGAGPRRKLAMLATRGCEHACRFCSATWMNGKRIRHHSEAFLVGEIRRVYQRYGVRMILFVDDNVTQDRAFFVGLCRAILAAGLPGLRVEFASGVRLESLDAEMLDLMRRVGVRSLTIAPESGSDRVRDLMGKGMRRDDIVRAARMIRGAGFALNGYFIVGFPGETADDRRQTYRMIRELGFDVFSLHKYQAIPGSPAFKKLVAEGRIAADHTSEARYEGDPVPGYNGEDPNGVDREILGLYAAFYLRRPWKIVHLLRVASLGGLAHALRGTLTTGIGRHRGAVT